MGPYWRSSAFTILSVKQQIGDRGVGGVGVGGVGVGEVLVRHPAQQTTTAISDLVFKDKVLHECLKL